tara:strand:+ start:5127 stop:5501 length:375 start_codon:yes stop_codon:yes gene_type:complete
MDPQNSTFNVIRMFLAIKYSMNGLTDAFFREPAFRLELIGTLILVPVALWLGDSGLEKSILISAVFAVLVVEIINSAIETAIDRIGPELNDLSRRAKDLGSAAVLLTLINVLVVWALVLADQII